MIIPQSFLFRFNLHGVEKPFMKNWATGVESSNFVSIIIDVYNIACPITFTSSDLKLENLFVAYSNFFLVL